MNCLLFIQHLDRNLTLKIVVLVRDPKAASGLRLTLGQRLHPMVILPCAPQKPVHLHGDLFHRITE